MVRLKAVPTANIGFGYIISIPYGAIKREIKVTESKRTREFQFLMVRLKECYYITNKL